MKIAEIPLMLQAKLRARAGGAKLPAAGRPEGHQARSARWWRLQQELREAVKEGAFARTSTSAST